MDKIEIKIFFDGREQAVRFWPEVPVVGDSIELYNGVKGLYRVDTRMWSGDKDLQVNIAVSKIY